jgi:hypothetical protein
MQFEKLIITILDKQDRIPHKLVDRKFLVDNKYLVPVSLAHKLMSLSREDLEVEDSGWFWCYESSCIDDKIIYMHTSVLDNNWYYIWSNKDLVNFSQRRPLIAHTVSKIENVTTDRSKIIVTHFENPHGLIFKSWDVAYRGDVYLHLCKVFATEDKLAASILLTSSNQQLRKAGKLILNKWQTSKH